MSNKQPASAAISSFADLPKLYARLPDHLPDDSDDMTAEIEHMQEGEGSAITRGDLRRDQAALIVTPAFEASFGDPLPLTIIEHGDEPGEYYMPEPFAAQAECGGIIAAICDLLTNTRLEHLAPEMAWGFVNSPHFVAGKLQREEDRLADQIGDMARRMEPGEVFNKKLEDKQLECQSLAEQRAAFEAMRDYMAAMYRACFGRAWSPSKGSKASEVTSASQINALDFLRARAEKRREQYDPQGPCVLISGPFDWHDWRIIFARLSQIKQRIPHMILVSTGGSMGVPAIASAWADKEGVPCVNYGLYGRGNGRAFKRNRELVAKIMPVEAVLCEGSGIQSHLYDLLNPESGRRVPTHLFLRADQAPDDRPKVPKGYPKKPIRWQREILPDVLPVEEAYY